MVRTLNNFKPRPVNALPYSFIRDRILEWLHLFFPSGDRDRGWRRLHGIVFLGRHGRARSKGLEIGFIRGDGDKKQFFGPVRRGR